MLSNTILKRTMYKSLSIIILANVHTRLRTNCSSLNLDLFIKSVSNSPLCVCGSLEDTQHYFFHCPNFTQQRIELLNEISRYSTPSLTLFLYGDLTLSYETNVLIFQAVHIYVQHTSLLSQMVSTISVSSVSGVRFCVSRFACALLPSHRGIFSFFVNLFLSNVDLPIHYEITHKSLLFCCIFFSLSFLLNLFL